MRVILSKTSRYAEGSDPFNPINRIGRVNTMDYTDSAGGFNIFVDWTDSSGNCYKGADSDLIPLFGGLNREKTRSLAREYSELTVVDNGADSENRWQLAVKEI